MLLVPHGASTVSGGAAGGVSSREHQLQSTASTAGQLKLHPSLSKPQSHGHKAQLEPEVCSPGCFGRDAASLHPPRALLTRVGSPSCSPLMPGSAPALSPARQDVSEMLSELDAVIEHLVGSRANPVQLRCMQCPE